MNLDYPELEAETRKRFKAVEKQLKEEKWSLQDSIRHQRTECRASTVSGLSR